MSENGGQDNGLVTSIAVNPNNTNIIYLGTAQGGVWRSSDGGNSWLTGNCHSVLASRPALRSIPTTPM